jgi:hypothetical protein
MRFERLGKQAGRDSARSTSHQLGISGMMPFGVGNGSCEKAKNSVTGISGNIFWYVLEASGWHQLFLVILTILVFLLEIVPLELQRRIINDLINHREYRFIAVLCGVYAGTVLVQGGTKLVLNIYRSWVGERAIRDLRRKVHQLVSSTSDVSSTLEAEGVQASMIVSEGRVDRWSRRRQPLRAAAASWDPLLGAGLYDQRRPLDGGHRISAVRSSTGVRSSDAGRHEQACPRADPDHPAAQHQRRRGTEARRGTRPDRRLAHPVCVRARAVFD